MKKAKIYKPAKTAMQSGKGNSKKWILEFETKNNSTNPLMKIQALIHPSYLLNFPIPLVDLFQVCQ